MNAAQALLREVLREVRESTYFDLSDDLTDAIREELERADPGPRILPITAYRAAHPTPPDPRLRGLRFDAEEA